MGIGPSPLPQSYLFKTGTTSNAHPTHPGGPIDSILTSLHSGRVSTRELAATHERPTQQVKLLRVASLLQYTWEVAWYFCIDHANDRPHRRFKDNLERIQQFSQDHKCSLESAWTQIDPLPN